MMESKTMRISGSRQPAYLGGRPRSLYVSAFATPRNVVELAVTAGVLPAAA